MNWCFKLLSMLLANHFKVNVSGIKIGLFSCPLKSARCLKYSWAGQDWCQLSVNQLTHIMGFGQQCELELVHHFCLGHSFLQASCSLHPDGNQIQTFVRQSCDKKHCMPAPSGVKCKSILLSRIIHLELSLSKTIPTAAALKQMLEGSHWGVSSGDWV